MSDTAISLRNLYKIFGPAPHEAMKRVQKGIDRGLISPNDDVASALLKNIENFLFEQQTKK